MASGTINKRSVDAAEKSAKDWFLWDDDVPGFGLKVTPAGGKVYVFQYRIARPGEAEKTAAKRYTIGKHGKLTPEQARKRAKELAALVSQGVDPRQRELDAIAASDEAEAAAAERARLEGELAFGSIADVWLDHYENEKDRRPSSVRQAKLIVNKHLKPKLKDKPLPQITRADLQPIIDAVPAKQRGMRRAVFAYASVLFGWAHKRGDIAENPLAGMAKPEAPKARDRVLADDEIAELWRATATLKAPFGAFFRLLVLTGQRRSEVAAINWAELDRATATWTIPASRAKNGGAHIVPLSSTVIGELDTLSLAAQVKAKAEEPDAGRWPKAGFVLTTTGRTPISGITKFKDALDAAIKAAMSQKHDDVAFHAWRIHDLRRTLATGLQRLGIRFEVTEAVLNHVSGSRAGVAGIYQRHNWASEKRHALDAWSEFVRGLLKPKKGDRKVVPLRKRGAS